MRDSGPVSLMRHCRTLAGRTATFVSANNQKLHQTETTDILRDQSALLTTLLKATQVDYSAKDCPKSDIVEGANGGNFTLRNNGAGIPFENMVRAIFPVEGESVTISDIYPIEQLLGADVLVAHSFRSGEHAVMRFEGGKRKSFHVEEDTAQDGVLIRVEWSGMKAKLLEKEGLLACIKGLEHQWKPIMYFNGERIDWAKMVMNK